jgi:hypothetical protein
MGLERKAVLRAASAHTVQYERRRPEQTLLHRLVREHLETFLAQVQARTGTGLPELVRDEFEAFLECGILAHGFLRVRCADCAHERLVAFSCKRRGFCPSCGARRMAESAAVLVDEVIPRVPVRQWVLSFPIRLRILFAARPELLTPVLRLIHRVIAGFLLKQAGLKRATADTGAVTLIQRFGSAANLNIHLHCQVLDGVYRRTEGEAEFQEARGFSLHAGVRCSAHQRKDLERLCRYITRPAIANERLKRDGAGDVVLQLKSAWRDGTTHIRMSPLEFMQRLAALVPRPRLHLIGFP